VGHLIAGVAVAWAAEAMQRHRPSAWRAGTAMAAAPVVTPLVLACAALALAPDFDILLASHRTFSHSIGAVALVAILSAAVARALGTPGAPTGLACAAAIGSHVVLDWLGRDQSAPAGLMALWPLSSAYFYSGVDLFADVSRRYWKPDEFILKNAAAIAREVAILALPAALAWTRRRRRLQPHVSRTTGQMSY
jgi:inner membrane protein